MLHHRNHEHSRIARLVGVFALVALVFAIGGSRLVAQSPRPKSLAGAMVVLPSIASLDAAERTQDRTITQLRRFRDDLGGVVAVRELLVVDTRGAGKPSHSLSFLGVEGELPSSSVSVKWQQTYAKFAGLFYQQSTFRIRDLGKALSNYSLFDFGPSARAGRGTRRTVVFPNSLDKSIWLIDVDTTTGVVLYAIEFDSALRVLSEVEALVFSPVASGATWSGSGGSGQSFVGASAQMGNPTGLVDPAIAATAEYSLDRVDVRADPWNGQQKLIMTYSDGIDQFLVSQRPGTSDPFAGLPGGGASGGHTIARYRDPAMSVFLFWDAGVAFEVAGNGALQRLDEVAKQVYGQALSQ